MASPVGGLQCDWVPFSCVIRLNRGTARHFVPGNGVCVALTGAHTWCSSTARLGDSLWANRAACFDTKRHPHCQCSTTLDRINPKLSSREPRWLLVIKSQN